MLTTSTDESLSKIYAYATWWTRVAKSIHFWSDSKYKRTADFLWRMSITSQNAGASKDLRIAFKVCVMLTLNPKVFKLLLNPIIQIHFF